MLARRSLRLGFALATQLVACSSKGASTTGDPPSARASTPSIARSSAPSASASVSNAASPPPIIKCPDDFYKNEAPAYCLDLKGRAPKFPEADGAWRTAEIGPMASVSFTKSVSPEAALKDVRDRFGKDDLKDRTKYKEEQKGAKTIVRYRSFDPENDPKAAEAVDVIVVVGASDKSTIRCEIRGDMTPPEACLSLVLPGE